MNADGRDDSGYRSQVDAAGNLLLREYTDGAGVASTRVVYTYDVMNDVLVEVDDLEADGVADVTSTWTYDASGNVCTLVTTGLWEADFAWSHTYDAAGNPLIATYDDDVDGVPELTVARTWDADGRALTETWDYESVDAWGTPYTDYGWAYTYDAAGNLLVAAYDSGLDGNALDVWTRTYDAAGNILTSTTDYGDDGVIDGVGTYTYDADGNVLSIESVNAYGSSTRLYTWVDGRVTRLQVDRDGALAWWEEYSYDAAGDLYEMVEYDAAGDADYRESYSYACG